MAPPTQEQVQEVMEEPGGKESGEDEKEISAYIVVRFGGYPTVASIYHVKIGIGGGEGAAVIRGKEGELLHPLLEFGEGGSRYLTCGILGSDMYAFTGNRDWYAPLPPVVGPYIFNTETKKIYEPVCLPAIAPKTTCWVISVQDKFFVLSNNLCSGKPVLQPSFELFDPKSGSSEALTSPPFHSDEFFRTYITGLVVVNVSILLVCMEHHPAKFHFFSYNLASGKWKTVSTIKGVHYPVFRGNACVVGDTVYGCMETGVPIAYTFSASAVAVNGGSDDDVADIFLGKPVKCTNVVQGDDWFSHPVGAFNHSARIAPAGKDMLCVVHAHESTMSCDTQIVSIKILQTQGPLSLKILSSASRAWNIEGSLPKLSYCCVQGV
ncbi:hypothetical protein ACSBR1_039790 [Camellia fascicularis]